MTNLNPGDRALVIGCDVKANMHLIGEVVDVLYEWPDHSFMMPNDVRHAGLVEASEVFGFEVSGLFWIIKTPRPMPLIDQYGKRTGDTYYGPWRDVYLIPLPKDDFDVGTEDFSGIDINFDKYRRESVIVRV